MARDVTVTFKDGTSHTYRNAPDDLSPDDVEARAIKDFNKQVKSLSKASASPSLPKQQDAIPSARQKIAELFGPSIEAVTTTVGGGLGAAAGFPALGPVGSATGAVVGAGAGKALGAGITRAIAGDAPQTLGQAFGQTTKDVVVGGTEEAFGRGILGPAVAKGGEFLNRLKNIKNDTYLKIMEGRGADILDALRTAKATPGAPLTAGEAAAPAGSTGFSSLQAASMKVPGLADQYAEIKAQAGAARSAQVDRALAAETAAMQKQTSSLQPLQAEAAGERLANLAATKREAMKKSVIAPAYERAFKASGNAKIDMTGVISQAEEILGRPLSSFDPSTAPQTVRKLMSLVPKTPEAKPVGSGLISSKLKIQPKTPPTPGVTLRDLDDIRKAVNADIASGRVSTDPAAGQALRNLGKIHSAIDDAVEQSPAVSEQAKDLYNNALNTYRTEYVPRFKTGVNEQLFRSTGLNEPKIKPEDVVTKYFQPRGVSEARNFLTLFGDSPMALQTARQGIEDLYLREVGKKITPQAHQSFLEKYADPLRVFDGAGINVLPRINAVATDAARLAEIENLAAKVKVKLPDALPPGASADVVNARIRDLTKNLSPQQLQDLNVVYQDLVRSGEYERLVKAGVDAGKSLTQIGTQTGRELNLPLPSFLNTSITIFNSLVKRLLLRIDDKLALQIAREMTSPAVAAQAVENAIKSSASREALRPAWLETGRVASIATGTHLRERSEPFPRGQRNQLAPDNRNALNQ